MKYLFVTDIDCLRFAMNNFERNFDGLYNLSNHDKYIKQLEKITPLMSAMGQLNYKKIIRKPMIFDNLEESFVKRIFGTTSIMELAKMYNSLSQTILDAFWLVKDNSINFNTTFVYNQETTSSTSTFKYISFTCADGSRHDTEFSQEEIDEVDKNFIGLQGIKEDSISGHAEPFNISEVKYNSIGRVDRILSYAILARSQSLLPLKITFYIDFLESLMPDDGGEIQHKVSEFVAKYIGGTYSDKITNYKLIKESYSIRSKYSHGQKMEKNTDTHDYLSMISNKLDGITRLIAKKIIFSDNDIFSKSSNDKEFRDWYLNMIFM